MCSSDLLGLLAREVGAPPATEAPSPPASAPPREPAPSEGAIAEQTALADLQPPTASGLAWIGIQGLNAEVEAADPIVAGRPILRLVAVPTEGRHYLAGQSTTLDKNRVYRITAWVKAAPGVKVEIEARDGINPRDGQPVNYGTAIFDPAARTVSTASGGLKDRGVEPGPGEWKKIWIDLKTADGQLVLAFGIISGDRKFFKGDGRVGLTFGGIDIASRS